MLQYSINKYITLKLEDDKTNIYINNKKFWTCTYILLNIPLEELSYYEQVDSIDQVNEIYDSSASKFQILNKISPEVEFWGHCSNLQAWVEKDYDMRIIDSRLGFPLLSELKWAGDSRAKEIFKQSRLTSIDRRKDYGEKREITIGKIYNIVCVVVFIKRNDTRIISARKANYSLSI